MMLLLGFIVGGVFGVVVMAVFRGAAMVNLEASRERWKDAAIRSGAFELVNECLHQDALQGWSDGYKRVANLYGKSVYRQKPHQESRRSMNLELLRELAKVDSELFLPDDLPDWFQLPEQGYAFARRGELKFREFFQYHLFFVLLDRIQARGWNYNLRNYHPGIQSTSGRAIVYTQGDNGIHKSDAESPVEALARAYVQACKAVAP